MIPEPIQFIQDNDGSMHFATDAQPLKTIIDIHSLSYRWIEVHAGKASVTITLDGKTVAYDRVAFGPHGEWICALRM
jgi:hypothetical protein